MDDTSPSPRAFTARILPWLLGAIFLTLYLLTLHPWIGASNVGLVGQLRGWEPDLAYSEPLLYLVTLPLRLLPRGAFPVALNVLAAVFGGLSVALLARCVALLPHDRMREQRVRGHSENSLLHISLAWLPVVFAAGLLGLQLTFWENATLQTGEMLDLVLFAVCVSALIEYRLDLRERWLWISALVYGAGITNNWAMIGFAPLFLVAVIWVRGWSFFNAGFLGRMLIWGLAGLAFYFVLPLFESFTDSTDLGFWLTLKANLLIQKTFLLGIARGRPLMLAMVSVLPLGLVSIRWQGTKSSSLERYATLGGIILLQVLWLAVAVYMAFDPQFSPRQMMYLDKGNGEVALLTFSFLGALSAGYFAGWFLLVGGTKPGKNWDRPNPLITLLGKAMAGLVMVGGLGVPAALAVKNWPAIHAQNSGATHDLARVMADQLPATPALVLSDDTMATRLLQAELNLRNGAPAHVLVETRRGPDVRYRQWLARRHQAHLPELQKFAEAQENVAGILANIVELAAAKGSVFYLNPSFGFFFEKVRSRPLGVIFALDPQPAEFGPAGTTTEALAAALRAWDAQSGRFGELANGRASQAPDAVELTVFWSRAANALGVELQRAGQLDAAGRVLEQARQLNPDNPLAAINGQVNAALRNQKPLAANLSDSVSRSPLVQTLNANGPIDEPVALLNYGRALIFATERLPRQAWYAFHRTAQLSPDNLAARFGEIEALMQGGHFQTARRQLDDLKARYPASSLSQQDLAGLMRLEVYYALAQNDLASAEKLIEGVRTQFAKDTSLLDLLTALYIRQGRNDEAIPLLEQWRKLRPDEPLATLRLAVILISRSQFDQALRALDQLLGIKPDNIPARINRAICLLRLNRLDDSQREYLALLEQQPELPLLHYGLGEIAVRHRNTNEAVEHFEHYLKFASTNTAEYAGVSARLAELKGGR